MLGVIVQVSIQICAAQWPAVWNWPSWKTHWKSRYCSKPSLGSLAAGIVRVLSPQGCCRVRGTWSWGSHQDSNASGRFPMACFFWMGSAQNPNETHTIKVTILWEQGFHVGSVKVKACVNVQCDLGVLWVATKQLYLQLVLWWRAWGLYLNLTLIT